MRSLLTLGLVAFLSVAWVEAQEKKDAKSGSQAIQVVELDRKEPVLYDKDVEPFLVKKCLVCHGGQVKEGKFDLTSYDTMIKGGKRGKPLVPGKGHESLIYKVSGRTEKPFMPPKGETPLSPEELALLKLWIDQGAKAPTTVRVRPAAVVTLPPAQVNPVRAVAVNADKTLVAAGRGNQVHLFDKDGNHVRNLVQPELTTPDKKPVEAAHLSIVESLAFSPDGKTLATGTYQQVILWDVATGAVKHKIGGFADRVVALAFSPDGKLLATGGGPPTEDGEIKIIDVDSGKPLLDIKSCHSDTVFGVSFSPDGTKLASAGADKYVKVWEMPTGKFLKSFEGHTHHVLDVGWKADGKLLASGGSDTPTATGPGRGVIKVWDYEKGEQVRTIQAHAKQVTRLLFVGKTNQFVTCSGDQTVKMWNVDNGGQVRTFQAGGDFLYAIGVSPDGTLVATGGEDGIVRVHSGTDGKLLKTLVPPGVTLPDKKP